MFPLASRLLHFKWQIQVSNREVPSSPDATGHGSILRSRWVRPQARIHGFKSPFMQDMQYYYVVVAITISRKLRRACDYDTKTNPRQDLCRVALRESSHARLKSMPHSHRYSLPITAVLEYKSSKTQHNTITNVAHPSIDFSLRPAKDWKACLDPFHLVSRMGAGTSLG